MLTDDRKKYYTGTERNPTESYLNYYVQLNETQRDKIFQKVMKDRTKRVQDLVGNKTVGQIIGGGMNLSDRLMNALVGQDIDEIAIFKDSAEERKFNELAKKALQKNTKYAEGGDVDEQMSMLMGPTHTMPDGTVMPGATHEEGEMSMEEPEMEPDSEMEDNYLDFIIDEALSEEEEDMLMSKLEQDEELSMLFDKVIEVASEFAGSGPVEGPGTGVSDSIPARLSDGEFVFTAKATEEIGSDNLMSMMKDAEARADERQEMANGGEVEEEETVVVKGDEPARQEIRVVKETVNPLKGIEDSNEIGQAINQQMLLDPDQKHVRS